LPAYDASVDDASVDEASVDEASVVGGPGMLASSSSSSSHVCTSATGLGFGKARRRVPSNP
jgi:hypothetical protein